MLPWDYPFEGSLAETLNGISPILLSYAFDGAPRSPERKRYATRRLRVSIGFCLGPLLPETLPYRSKWNDPSRVPAPAIILNIGSIGGFGLCVRLSSRLPLLVAARRSSSPPDDLPELSGLLEVPITIGLCNLRSFQTDGCSFFQLGPV
jgi:hypothetical protein